MSPKRNSDLAKSNTSRREHDVVSVLQEIAAEISAQKELQQILALIVKQAAYLAGAEGSTLAVCEPDTDSARVVALYNVSFDREELIIKPEISGPGRVLLTGEPAMMNGPQDGAADPYQRVLSVPLLWDCRVIGVLTVLGSDGRRGFPEEDVQVLSLLANLAGTAINHAKLYSKVTQLNQHLECLSEEQTSQLAETRAKLAQKTVQLQRLLASTVYLQEEERIRIAFDLHDGSNQLITGTLLEIQAAQQSLQGGRLETALDKLNTAKEYLRQIDLENRRIISGLRPPGLDTLGLVEALRRQVETYQEYTKTDCTLEVSGEPIRLAPHVETTVFRIIQECFNNISAHAQAQCIQIKLKFCPAGLQVEAIDNGKGFAAELVGASNRMGLIGMRERALSIGGRLEVQSKPGQGTRVIFDLPLPAPHLPRIAVKDTSNPGRDGLKAMDRWEKRAAEQEWSEGGDQVDPDEEDDIDTGEKITPEDFTPRLARAIAELERAKALRLTRAGLHRGLDPYQIMEEGVLIGLKEIGSRFESSYYFLGDLLIGSSLTEECMNILKPYLQKKMSDRKKGIVVIGAVSGDVHSIGYGLVAKQLELAGYEVHDLGVNVPSMVFIEKACKVKADIIAASAFLITTIPYCNEIIMNLRDMGLRQQFKIIIGGTETSQAFADSIRADGWAYDAFEAVRLCNKLMKEKAL